MPVSLMLCIILLSALPGGGFEGEFVAESKLHCSNPFFFFFPLMCSCDWPFDYSESPKAHGLKTKAGL